MTWALLIFIEIGGSRAEVYGRGDPYGYFANADRCATVGRGLTGHAPHLVFMCEART